MFKHRRTLIGAFTLTLAIALVLAWAAGPGARAQDEAPTSGQAPLEPEAPSEPQAPLGTAFTYQGQLSANGEPAPGPCDLRFSLHDAATDGAQVGSTLTQTAVELSDGRFAVILDFGVGIFTGDARWLGIAVQCAGDAEYTTLGRQALRAAPYALYSLSTATHDHLGETWTGSSTSLVITGTFVSPNSAPLVLVNSALDGHGLLVEAVGRSGRYIQSAGDDAVSVDVAGGDGVGVFSAGRDGIGICGTGGRRFCEIDYYHYHGIEVGNAEHDGVHVISAGRDGVFVDSVLGDGVDVSSAGGDGFRVCTTGDRIACDFDDSHQHGLEVGNAQDDGVHVISAGRDGVNVVSATTGIRVASAFTGVSVSSVLGDGVSVWSAGFDGFQVCSTGNRIACDYDDSHRHGLEVGNAEHDGVHVTQAGRDGLRVESAGGNGLRVNGAGLNNVELWDATYDGVQVWRAGRHGVHVYSADEDGVHAITLDVNDEWGLYTPDKIYGANVTTAGPLTFVAQNGDAEELEPGDLVAGIGLAAPFADSPDPVPLVGLAGGERGAGIVGVVLSRFVAQEEAEEIETDNGVRHLTHFRTHSAEGPVAPGEHLLIVVLGVAQVKIDLGTQIKAGQRLTASNQGSARGLRTESLNGMQVTEGAPVVGVALAASAPESGQTMIPVFVTLR